MRLYHGTNVPIEELKEIYVGTWFAGSLQHAYRLAERRAKQRGGVPTVLELEVNPATLHRVVGRKLPSYQFKGGRVTILAVHNMFRMKLEQPLRVAGRTKEIYKKKEKKMRTLRERIKIEEALLQGKKLEIDPNRIGDWKKLCPGNLDEECLDWNNCDYRIAEGTSLPWRKEEMLKNMDSYFISKDSSNLVRVQRFGLESELVTLEEQLLTLAQLASTYEVFDLETGVRRPCSRPDRTGY